MEFDLESDLWNQAEFTRAYVEPPPSLAKGKGRTSIYDDDPDELVGNVPSWDVPEAQVKMIRGRALKVKNDERPGGLEAYNKTRKDIREVCGVGYSNELIEKYIRCNQRDTGEGEASAKEEKAERVKMPDLSFKKHPHPPPHRGEPNGMIFPIHSDETNFKLNNESDFPSLK